MVALAVFVTGLILGCWNAYTLLLMYDWFAVPLGAPVLAYWHFYGLRMLVWMTAWTPTHANDEAFSASDKLSRHAGLVVGVAFAHSLCLLFAWLIHTFAGPF